MTVSAGLLAVIPARGGSKGLPGKNIRPFVGLPLVAHSVLLARMCPEIDRVVVSTDVSEIADVAQSFGADVPFMRPSELAQDETPMWPVLRHTLEALKDLDGIRYECVLLLDPTSPGRWPVDVTGAYHSLLRTPAADGIIGVSRPDFNPLWHCVFERNGWMTDVFEDATDYGRRQDVPIVYRINASLYIWRSDFVRREKTEWRRNGKHLLYEIPEFRAIHIDDLQEFEKAELLVKNGIITLPWLADQPA